MPRSFSQYTTIPPNQGILKNGNGRVSKGSILTNSLDFHYLFLVKIRLQIRAFIVQA